MRLRSLKIIQKIGFVVIESLLRSAAETEFRIFEHEGRKKFRTLYLALMRVQHSEFTLGIGLYIRERGNLFLGRRVGLGSFCKLWNYHPIYIGDDFLAAGGLTLNTGGHVPETLAPQGGPIRIGNRVWCGLNVTILAGVTIGDDVVIGAGSVVIRDVPSKCVVAGVPAKYIRPLDRTPEDIVSVERSSL